MKTDKTSSGKTRILSPNFFPVVGVGASAGGLDAFKKLLKAIPEDSGMAFVLVQHLDPNHESLLTDLLQKVTSIPVLEISDDIKVESNHIYIIPSNKMLIANDGVLELSPRASKIKRERNLPIDLFFTSLAEVHQSHAIGIVLSGTASDGTAGLKAIKDHGGITFAQDEESAAFREMPVSAVQAGVVDFILPPDQMPQKILEVNRNMHRGDDNQSNGRVEDEEVLKQILLQLRIRKGTDFSYYKQTTIRRRILRRVALNKSESSGAYLRFLRESKAEQDILYQDLLIPVTGFFRDPKSFEYLCEKVIPQVIKDKPAGEPIRVWVTACSTGEEAYSMAMCFYECMGKSQRKVQIFATDISEPAIAKARAGIYAKSEVTGVNASRLNEFFTPGNGDYLVNKSLRDMCVFAEHNFLKDPPFGKMDLVSCRNVLIYMEPYLQKKALTTFHYALNSKGLLFLGRTETANSVHELFSVLRKNEKLYTRNDVPVRYSHTASPKSKSALPMYPDNRKAEVLLNDFQRAGDEIMLSHYTPAGVVVNEAMEIVHFRGSTARYLEQLPGKPSHNLIKMARHGLGFELRSLLHKAKKEHTKVSKENIAFKIDGNNSAVTIEVIPLSDTIELHYLVLFHDSQSAARMLAASDKKNSGKNKGKLASDNKSKIDDRDVRIKQLEQELAQTLADMRSITDDQEATNEELQSDNEELSSTSEELQSLNEELETSKEELQSSNEELMVVNQEMTNLNEQLKAARDYSETIVGTTHEPLLVLDSQLKVKSANRSFYQTFQMTQRETEGKLLYNLGNKQWDIPVLRSALEKFLFEKESFFDFEVTTQSFQNMGPRTMLLNAREMSGETSDEKLILLAIEDVTEKVSVRKKIEDSNRRYHMMLMQSPFAFSIMKGKDMVIALANDLMKDIWGKGKQVEGKKLLEVLPEVHDQPFAEMLNNVYATGIPFHANEILGHVKLNGKIVERYFNVVYQPHYEVDETISGVITIAHEVTTSVLARRIIEESEHRYRMLIEEATVATALFLGPDMVIQYANDLMVTYWGKDKTILGRPLIEAMPELKDQPFLPYLYEVYNTGNPYVGVEEKTNISIDGILRTFYFNFTYKALREKDGNIYGIHEMAVDVTSQVLARKALQESESHFRLMADMMPTKISNTDTGGNIIYFNKHWLDFTGLSFDDLKNLGYQKIMHPDEVMEFEKRFRKAAETGTDLEIEMRFINKDGDYKWHLNLASPVKDENGVIKMWVGSTTEIHQQVEQKVALERAVKERTVELENANRKLVFQYQEKEKQSIELMLTNKELESFTYVTSHDLQEPLRKIQIFIDRILDGENENLSANGQTYFIKVQKAAMRMQSLIQDLLAFSRLNSKDRKFEDTELNVIVEEAKAELKETIEEHQATIEVKELCSAYIIPFQFRQLMINLLTNALKFSRPGLHPHIIIQSVNIITSKTNAENLTPGLEYCHISVKDNGIGFDPRYKDKVFELFQRLHKKEDYPGTGIGLFSVKKVVENHNGYIFATSALNEGATFDIYIPINPAMAVPHLPLPVQ